MLSVELYISGTRLDLFEQEGIRITDSIKDLKDPARIFTPFSMPFTVPASPTNNGVFRHYYNPDIVNGYDARFYKDAEVRISGATYRKGQIALNEVKMANGVPVSYSLVFIGQGKNLKDLFKEDKLSSLQYLDRYNHAYTAANVLSGFTVGLGYSGGSMIESSLRDIVYPLVYHPPDLTHALRVNAGGTAIEDQNGNGVYYQYLKPGIKVLNIIDAIEDQYGITFSTDFFTSLNSAMNSLYLHLHRSKGRIVGGEELQERTFDYSGTTFSTFTTFTQGAADSETQTVELSAAIADVVGTGTYSVQFIDEISGQILFTKGGLTGSNTVQHELTSSPGQQRTYGFKVRVFTEGGITRFDLTFSVDEVFTDSIGTTTTTTNFSLENDIVPLSEMVIRSQVPDITVIDFLTGLFKMFNLVAEFTSDTEIYVDTLDDYYAASSVEWDISRYAHADQHVVKRSLLFNKIDFGWKDNESYLITRRNERVGVSSGKGYGYSLYYGNNDNLVYDGQEYTIELPFEKFLFERIDDDGTFTPVIYGLMLDDDEENPSSYLGAPLLYFVDQKAIDIGDPAIPLWDIDTGAVFTNSTIASGNVYDDYLSASNTNGDASVMLNWDSEIDEFGLTENLNSLFALYYKTYIENAFDAGTRIFEVRATLPLQIVSRYKLNDRIVLWGRRFKINSIDVDITTGDSNLILITE